MEGTARLFFETLANDAEQMKEKGLDADPISGVFALDSMVYDASDTYDCLAMSGVWDSFFDETMSGPLFNAACSLYVQGTFDHIEDSAERAQRCLTEVMVRSAARFVNILQTHTITELKEGGSSEIFQRAMQRHNEHMERQKEQHPDAGISTVGEQLGANGTATPQDLSADMAAFIKNMDENIKRLENHANDEDGNNPGYL